MSLHETACSFCGNTPSAENRMMYATDGDVSICSKCISVSVTHLLPHCRIVPIEPTHAMREAAAEGDPAFFKHVDFVWNEMIKAAPKPGDPA